MVYTISGFKVKPLFFTVVLYTYAARVCGYTLTINLQALDTVYYY
nr:MAG TPA: hypothetical protein [Caudoviricetes sp.]